MILMTRMSRLADNLEDTGQRVVDTLTTPQRRYKNGRALAPGDSRPLFVGSLILLFFWVAHEYAGLPIPSGPIMEFAEHLFPIVFMIWGIRHARTRKPE